MKKILPLLAFLVVALAASPGVASASGWHGCEGSDQLRVQNLGCAKAEAVLAGFFGGGPKIDPGPAPRGWRCRQQQGDHTSEGGDTFMVGCHQTRRPSRRFRYRWNTDV
jgi:hypothetical protein